MKVFEFFRKVTEGRLQLLELEERQQQLQERRERLEYRRQQMLARQQRHQPATNPQPLIPPGMVKWFKKQFRAAREHHHYPAATQLLHQQQALTVKALMWHPPSPRFAQATVTRWHVMPETTFLAGQELISLRSGDKRQPRKQADTVVLTAPEAGVLLKAECKTGDLLSSASVLGRFIPLADWRSFVTRLEQQQRTLQVAETAKVQARQSLKQCQLELQRAGSRKATLTQQHHALEQQLRPIRALQRRELTFLQQTPFQSLAEHLLLLQQQHTSPVAPRTELIDVSDAIQDVLELVTSLSCGELLRVLPDMVFIAHVEKTLSAADPDLLRVWQDRSLSHQERLEQLRQLCYRRWQQVGTAMPGNTP